MNTSSNKVGRPKIRTPEEKAQQRKEYFKKYYETHRERMKENSKKSYQNRRLATVKKPEVADVQNS